MKSDAPQAALEHEHTPEAIRERLAKGSTQNYLRDFVYGGIDGAVTTFAVVAGTIGANLATRIVLILGAANLIADGFSMTSGERLTAFFFVMDLRPCISRQRGTKQGKEQNSTK